MLLEELETTAHRYYAENKQRDTKLLPNLHVFKREEISEFEASVYEPVISLVLRGAKETRIGSQSIP